MQLNVELPEDELKRVKKDAIELGVTLSAYAAKAFQNFRSQPIAVRRVHFDNSHKKIGGRKIQLATPQTPN